MSDLANAAINKIQELQSLVNSLNQQVKDLETALRSVEQAKAKDFDYFYDNPALRDQAQNGIRDLTIGDVHVCRETGEMVVDYDVAPGTIMEHIADQIGYPIMAVLCDDFKKHNQQKIQGA